MKRKIFNLNFLLKSVIGIMLLLTIWYQLFVKEDIYRLYENFNWDGFDWFSQQIILVIFFSVINWSFEALKWKEVMKSKSDFSFLESLQFILQGISIGIITPARIGEYYGRTLNMQSQILKIQSVLATLFSSLAQNIVNISFGFLGSLLIMNPMDTTSDRGYWVGYGLLLSILFFLFLLFFLIGRILPLIQQLNHDRIRHFLVKLADIPLSSKIKLLVFSIARYTIYLSQYVLLLQYFNIPLGIIDGVIAVSVIYLIQTGIPLPGGLAILARSSVAIAVFSLFNINEIPVLLASWSLWVINLMVPALLGMLLISKIKKMT